MRGLAADLRDAARALLKNPAFTLTTLATLCLAIGANITVFTLANALIFARIPVMHPGRLVEISTLDPRGEKRNISVPVFQLFERRAKSFSSLLAWSGGGVENLQMNGASFAGAGDAVGGDYYSTLGVQPALGRFFTRRESSVDGYAPSSVAVIGFEVWQRRYHGDPNVLGRTLLMNGKPFTIVGVHPKPFSGLIREIATDVTIPLTASSDSAQHLFDRKRDYLTVIGRLRDGVSASQALAEMESLWPAIRRDASPGTGPERPAFLSRRIQIQPAAQGISYLRARFARPLALLFGIVALLQLLACVNLANVALARGQARAGELSLRAALGAGPWRLLRASLVESLTLAAAGAIPGLALAYWGSSRLMDFMWQGYVPLTLSARPDAAVVAFTAAAAILAGVGFGILPAWRAGCQAPLAALQTANHRIVGSAGFAGRILVTVQVALSFAILAGALLLARSLGNVAHQDLGFRSNRLLVAQLFPRTTYKGLDQPAYFRQLLAALQSMPGVDAATIAHDRPVGMAWKETVQPADIAVTSHLVAPGFFDTLGMRVIDGRDFTLNDDEGHLPVAIVSARLARQLEPSGGVIGRHIKLRGASAEMRIVGIVSDAVLDDPRSPASAVYQALLQNPDFLGWAEAIIRTPGDPVQLARSLRLRIETLGREYPLRIETVSDELDRALLPERLLALLTGSFAGLGLLLAVVGLYGLLSYSVARRTGEIGIRVALGSTRRAIAALFLREIALLLVIGLAAGLAITSVAGRTLSATLYGISSADPLTLLLGAGVLLVTAALAGLNPVLRATRVDPGVALRHE